MKTTMYVVENADDSKTIIEGSTIDMNGSVSALDIFAKAKAMKRQMFVNKLNEHQIFDNIKVELK